MGELSRWEDLLKTGSEDTVKPLSRVEAILRGEDITPQSRIEKLLKEGGGGGSVLYDEYEITQNKTKIVPPVGYDGFSSVITNVPDPILITKNVTANGEFNAEDDNADGYSSVNVNVPQLFSKVELYQSEYDALTPAEKADPSKFYVIKPGKPEPDYLYKWDFTKSLVDEVNGIEATLYNCERDENGIYVNGGTDDITFTNVAFEIGKTYEFKFGYMSDSPSGQTLVSFSNDFLYDARPFSWSSGSKVWGINQDGWKPSNVKVETFPNSTLKLVILSDRVDIYQDDTKLGYITIVLNSYTSFRVGSRSSSTYRNFYLEAIRIYANEEV